MRDKHNNQALLLKGNMFILFTAYFSLCLNVNHGWMSNFMFYKHVILDSFNRICNIGM